MNVLMASPFQGSGLLVTDNLGLRSLGLATAWL